MAPAHSTDKDTHISLPQPAPPLSTSHHHFTHIREGFYQSTCVRGISDGWRPSACVKCRENSTEELGVCVSVGRWVWVSVCFGNISCTLLLHVVASGGFWYMSFCERHLCTVYLFIYLLKDVNSFIIIIIVP
eukprot:Rmarinus@m.23866